MTGSAWCVWYRVGHGEAGCGVQKQVKVATAGAKDHCWGNADNSEHREEVGLFFLFQPSGLCAPSQGAAGKEDMFTKS